MSSPWKTVFLLVLAVHGHLRDSTFAKNLTSAVVNASKFENRTSDSSSYGIMDQFIDEQAALMKERSGGRTNNGTELLWSGGRVHVLTVETRKGNPHRLRGPPGWDYYVENVGAGHKWRSFKTKPLLMKEGLADIPDDDLVVFVDGADTMFAGCHKDTFLKRFTKILDVTKAEIVVAAEYNCYEIENCTTFPDTNREKVLNAFGMESATVDEMADGHCLKGDCKLKYLNSGFYAGYSKNVKRFLSMVLDAYKPLGNRHTRRGAKGDQAYIADIFEAHPEMVVLDYAGALTNSLSNVKSNEGPFQFQRSRNAWVNSLLKDDACFFHGNGQGNPVLQDLINEQGNATG